MTTKEEYIDKYQHLLKDHSAHPEVGSGWIPLIDKLTSMINNKIETIKNYNEGWLKNKVVTPEKYESNKKLMENFKIVQIKEKFGGLRFYIEGTDYKVHQDIHGWVQFAEAMSYELCEVCGTNQGLGSTSGWMRTICESCATDIGKGDVWLSREDRKNK
jgi:hypothetical protein